MKIQKELEGKTITEISYINGNEDSNYQYGEIHITTSDGMNYKFYSDYDCNVHIKQIK